MKLVPRLPRNREKWCRFKPSPPLFRVPVKQRHREDARLKTTLPARRTDVSEAEFFRFRERLEKSVNGAMLSALATVQYFQALRVSEAAGLFWEDVRLVRGNPQESRLVICRHIEWSRKRGMVSRITPGFKNATANGGTKELPMFPETYSALVSLFAVGARGLVFRNPEGNFFTYSQISSAYSKAFKAAGLPYRATHVMRHGGCQSVYEETGDLDAAAQVLGNTSPDTVRVYAKQRKGALTKLVRQRWERSTSHLALVANGRISPGDSVTE